MQALKIMFGFATSKVESEKDSVAYRAVSFRIVFSDLRPSLGDPGKSLERSSSFSLTTLYRLKKSSLGAQLE